MNGQILTAEQLAERWQVKVGWVYQKTRSGAIPRVPLPGLYYRYRLDTIERSSRESLDLAKRERSGATSTQRPPRRVNVRGPGTRRSDLLMHRESNHAPAPLAQRNTRRLQGFQHGGGELAAIRLELAIDKARGGRPRGDGLASGLRRMCRSQQCGAQRGGLVGGSGGRRASGTAGRGGAMTVRIPKALLIVVLLLLIGGGAAAGGYYYSESQTDEQGLKDQAYDDGYDRGLKEGRQEGESDSLDAEFRQHEKGRSLGAKLAIDPAYFDAGRAYLIRISEDYPKGEPEEWNANSLEMEEGKSYFSCGAVDFCFSEGE